MSFLAINSMISISIPGIPSTIQSVMIKYIFFDIFYTELWIGQFMASFCIDVDAIKNDSSLSEQFSDNGYRSH